MTICFGALSKPLLLLPPQLWELIGGEKPGRMPRWSRLFYEDWKRGRRGVQALACVLARVDSQGGNPSLAAASRRTSTAEVSISPFQLSCWKLCACSCVCLCAGDYMVCVSVCTRVCVCARVRLLKDLLFGAVNFNDVCQPQYVESPGCGRDWSFLSLLWVYLKEVLFFFFFKTTTTTRRLRLISGINRSYL